MNHALIAESSPDVAPWLLREDMFVCVACGQWADRGFLGTVVPDEDAPCLCRDCAEDLVTAYVASSPGLRLIRVQAFEVPVAPLPEPPENISTSDITVSVTFDPESDPRSVDIQVSPEPQSGAAALELIELALVRGCEYLSSYRGAEADDGDEEVAS